MAGATGQSIDDFIDGFGGGLRPNRFLVIPTFPSGVTLTNANAYSFFIRAAALPSSDLAVIPIAYRGRTFKMPGARTYTPWQMVVLDDVGGELWDVYHLWSSKILKHKSNKIASSGTNMDDFSSLMASHTIKQLDINGTTEKTVVLNKCWPSEVGPVEFSMADNENYVTFTVTLEYQYFTTAIGAG
jgi:hypothetical protein